jgi:small-conductance mechanosensitive channel
MVSVFGTTVELGLIEDVAKALILIVGGYIIARTLSHLTEKAVGKKVNPHVGKISRNVVFYAILGVAIITALGIFIEITTIIAAAGIAGIAIGMAAQRSVSNIISGIFLLADQPFAIGDAVVIGGDGGVVLDISLFSTRLRTFDNKYLRIPNDAVANAKIINLSTYDLRRLDIPVGVAYKEDVGRAVEMIENVVKKSEKVLVEPEPQVLVTGFGESSIDLNVRVWVQRSELFLARTELVKNIKSALDEGGIEIPFPYRTLTFAPGEAERFKGS